MENFVVKAREIAIQAHKGQKRWNGEDYFSAHIEQVVNLVFTNSINMPYQWQKKEVFDLVLATAYLHDVIEDTHIALGDLWQFPPLVTDMLFVLTKPKNMLYFDYIMGILDSQIWGAKYIKVCDLTQNMSDANEREKTGSRYAKYQFAKYVLSYRGNVLVL